MYLLYRMPLPNTPHPVTPENYELVVAAPLICYKPPFMV
jgi:hypothetical protein